MKICPRCKETKSEDYFYSSGYCKPCNNARSAEWYANNVETKKQSALKYYYKKKYGMSLDDVQVLYDKQDSACAICQVQMHLGGTLDATQACIDHDHTTGEVRGMLCNLCNQGLGHFRDCRDNLLAAYDYLKEYND